MVSRERLADDHEQEMHFKRLREQFSCLLHGHRDLAPADAYAEELPDRDEEKELHYCGACGSPVWISRRRSHERWHWESRSADDRLASGVF